MMLRYLLLLVLIAIVARAFWKIVDSALETMRSAPPSGRSPVSGVPMERDPVCGTFVTRERAFSVTAGDRQVYFCSVRCRDKYQARTA